MNICICALARCYFTFWISTGEGRWRGEWGGGGGGQLRGPDELFVNVLFVVVGCLLLFVLALQFNSSSFSRLVSYESLFEQCFYPWSVVKK